MADAEWYTLDPSPVGTQYPNFESADAAAQKAAMDATDGVAVVKCTATTVRRYQRAVTITATDVTTTP
jgi:hypothetical protein